MTTNTKAIITKNQKHIISYFHPSDYGTRTKAEAFMSEVQHYMRGGYGPTPYHAIYQMVWNGDFLVSDYDIIQYLKSLGLTDERRVVGFKNYRNEGPMELYASLLARDGAKLYGSYMAGMNPLAPKKKKVVRRV